MWAGRAVWELDPWDHCRTGSCSQGQQWRRSSLGSKREEWIAHNWFIAVRWPSSVGMIPESPLSLKYLLEKKKLLYDRLVGQEKVIDWQLSHQSEVAEFGRNGPGKLAFHQESVHKIKKTYFFLLSCWVQRPDLQRNQWSELPEFSGNSAAERVPVQRSAHKGKQILWFRTLESLRKRKDKQGGQRSELAQCCRDVSAELVAAQVPILPKMKEKKK